MVNAINRRMTEKPGLFKSTWRTLVALLFLGLTMPSITESSNESQIAIKARTEQKLAKVQIPFVANQGQAGKEIKFYARTFAGTVSVTETGQLVYSLPKLEDNKPVTGVALKEEIVGGKVREVTGENQAVTKLNYFKGNDRSKWQSNIPTYDVVSLGEVYEGIDVKLKAYGNNVEKLFYVKPGAEPETIKIQISGGKEIKVNESGELEVETAQGTVRFSKPVAFQDNGGSKEFVEVAYLTVGNEYGFQVKGYDKTKAIIIDPILAATFLGGVDDDSVSALAMDIQGNIYAAGFTNSPDFPGIGPGSADSTFEGDFEGFVVKLNSDLSCILAATFLGGANDTNYDVVLALAIDLQGNIYAAGFTNSPDFPGIGPGSADSTFEDYDANEGFIAKLNSNLSSILAATFLGGSNDYDVLDAVGALAIDLQGNIYAAGSTESRDFPGIGPGSADSTFAAWRAGYVAKLNSNLSSILAATFLGGSGLGSDVISGEHVNALAIDLQGNVYAAGFTESRDFPGIGPGSADSSFGGWACDTCGFGEGFVVKLNSDLSLILAATFLGGSTFDLASNLALDSLGNVYVAGVTASSDFPGMDSGSADSSFEGGSEGFVVKLDPNLSAGPSQEQIVNNLVNLAVQSTSLNPNPVPGGPAGVFTITARLTNTSTQNILEPINAIVKTLTNGNKLLSAKGNGGVGSKQAIDAGSDDALIPKESATVQFRIGLANRNRFNFFVDVFGIVNGDD